MLKLSESVMAWGSMTGIGVGDLIQVTGIMGKEE